MKKTDTLLLPLFLGVVALLTIGSVGEQLSSLFEKVKNFLTAKSTATETAMEVSKQLK